MRKCIYALLTLVILCLSSCDKERNIPILKRIENGFLYIDQYFENCVHDFLYLPKQIPNDIDVLIEYKTLSPNLIDSYGKTFQNQYIQTGLFLVTLSVESFAYEKVYEITIMPAESFPNNLEITFINIGQGDTILLQLPNEEVVLIDAGDGFYNNKNDGWEIIYDYLKYKGITSISYFVATHNHPDHSLNIPKIIEHFTIEKIFSSFDFQKLFWDQQFLNVTYKPLLIYPNQGDYIVDLPGLYLRVICNLEGYNGNAASLMLWLKYADFEILFASDGTIVESEKSILDSELYVKSDVIKVGHHGMNDSSGEEFIKKVLPEVGILTTLYSNIEFAYDKEAIKRLRIHGLDLIETSRNNHIIIHSDGKTYIINSLDKMGNYNSAIVYNYE